MLSTEPTHIAYAHSRCLINGREAMVQSIGANNGEAIGIANSKIVIIYGHSMEKKKE